MKWKRWALALSSVGFGVMVATGGAFEVANLLIPSLFPEAQDHPIMRLHHTESVVFAWTLASNLVGLVAGGALVATGIGLGRRRAWSARLGRAAARVMFALAGGGAVVCAIYLVPPLVGGVADPARRAESLALLVSIAAATLFMPVVPVILHRALAPARAARLFANKSRGPVLPMNELSPPRLDLSSDRGVRAGH